MSNPITEHFRLKRHPFSPEIEAHALFKSRSFEQGERRLELAAHNRGAVLVAGDSGAGKTALVRYFCHRLASSNFRPLYTATPMVKAPLRPVVEDLLVQVGEKVPFNNAARGMALLQEAFLKLHDQNTLPVVVVDDVHHLNEQAWLQLKTLTNYEMDSRLPFLMLLLGAREEVLSTLSLSRLEEVRSRFLFCYTLRGLEREETGGYLKAHLEWAGCDRPVFPKEIADEIHQRTHGIPRMVNRLAYSALVAAACERKDLVDGPCLEQALSEHLFVKSGKRKEAAR
jgi:type II secretory pathway predicted ATPase ExeA